MGAQEGGCLSQGLREAQGEGGLCARPGMQVWGWTVGVVEMTGQPDQRWGIGNYRVCSREARWTSIHSLPRPFPCLFQLTFAEVLEVCTGR